MEVYPKIINSVLEPLNDTFVYGQLLGSALNVLNNNTLHEEEQRAVEQIVWVADSHYEIMFSRDTHISERVISPGLDSICSWISRRYANLGGKK